MDKFDTDSDSDPDPDVRSLPPLCGTGQSQIFQIWLITSVICEQEEIRQSNGTLPFNVGEVRQLFHVLSILS
jgi:hypothetical protein